MIFSWSIFAISISYGLAVSSVVAAPHSPVRGLFASVAAFAKAQMIDMQREITTDARITPSRPWVS
jgi:hypothetical protein